MIQIKPEYIEKKDHTRISRNFYNTLGSEVGCYEAILPSRTSNPVALIPSFIGTGIYPHGREQNNIRNAKRAMKIRYFIGHFHDRLYISHDSVVLSTFQN